MQRIHSHRDAAPQHCQTNLGQTIDLSFCTASGPAPDRHHPTNSALFCTARTSGKSYTTSSSLLVSSLREFSCLSTGSTFASFTPVSMLAIAFKLLAAAGIALAADQTIQVGQNGLTFTPNSVTAAVGDQITFVFSPKNHSVTQSSFASPCTHLVNATTNQQGFDSGFVPVAAGSTNTTAFTIRVTQTTPIWFYCAQGNHCTSGMVGAINAPTTGNTIGAFVAKAMGGAAASGGAAAPGAAASSPAAAGGAGAAPPAVATGNTGGATGQTGTTSAPASTPSNGAKPLSVAPFSGLALAAALVVALA